MAKQKLVPYVHTDGKTWEHYYVDATSDVIYFMKSHAGKKIKFSTKQRVPNGTKAKAFANKEFDFRTGKSNRHVRTLIKEELVSWLLLKEGEGHAYDTLNNIRRAAKQIDEFWGDKLPNEINRDTLSEWYAFWRVEHPDIQLTNAVKYMRNFCRYLHEKTFRDQPLLASIPTIRDPNAKEIKAKTSKKKERIFSLRDFQKIYATAHDTEDRLAALFMYAMGTRIDETLKLEFGSTILLEEPVPVYRWRIGSNKADLAGEHALHETLVGPLVALREERRREGTTLLFPQVRTKDKARSSQNIDWEAWRDRAGLDFHWTPHTFRHTCLSNLFNDPKNPHAVICKLYRVSLGVALDTYVKVTTASMLAMRGSIVIDLVNRAPETGAVATLVRPSDKLAESEKIGVPKGIAPTNSDQGAE